MTVICIVSDKSVAVIAPEHKDTEKALAVLHAGGFRYSEIASSKDKPMDWEKVVKWLSVAYERIASSLPKNESDNPSLQEAGKRKNKAV